MWCINYKLVFLGDSAVGKSCIVTQFTTGKFQEFQEPTIGAAFSTATIETNNQKIRFEIWDTAGQERYRSLAPMYYRGAKFAVVVFDITSKQSFEGAKSWINEIKRKATPDCIIILVGNKSDLDDKRVVSEDEAHNFSEHFNISYIESSAKTNHNIQEIFYTVANKLPQEEILIEPENNNIFTLVINTK